MTNCLYNITGARLTLGTDHCCAFSDAAQSFTQITRTAYKRNLELCLINVVYIVRRRQHFTLVNIVDLDCFQNLCLNKVADTALRHNRNGNCFLNTANHLRVAHAGNAACCTDVSRNALQRHNCTCACCFGNLRLLRCGYVHNDAALQHLGQLLVQLILYAHVVQTPLLFGV